MKKNWYIVLLTCLLGLTTVSAQVNVTFEVDMNEVAVSQEGVHIAGSFQNWDPATNPLTDLDGDSIYTVTIQLAEGTYEYKFLSSNTWGSDEAVPGACAVNNNREIVVAGEDFTVSTCFAKCTACNVVTPKMDYTFAVNMNGVAVDPAGVHIAGAFNSWDPSATTLIHMGDSIYAVQVELDQDVTTQFKFVNGNEWGKDEMVPVECAMTENRYVTPTATDSIYYACFAACNADCDGDVEPVDSVNVTLAVNMNGVAVDAAGVYVAGSFNAWAVDATMMAPMGDSVYAVTLKLPKDAAFQFKYINGNEWGKDEMVPVECAMTENRYFTPTATDSIYYACFGACDAACDTTAQDTTHTDSLCVSTLPLELNFYDSLICAPEFNVILEAFGDFEAFDWSNEEVGPSIDITSYGWYKVMATDSAGCTALDSAHVKNMGCAEPVEVTFIVDMTLADSVSANGVHLAGGFQDWTPDATTLDSLGQGKYGITLSLLSGDAIEFKFLNGNTWDDIEGVPALCQVGGGNSNRTFIVPNENYTFETCYGECGPCVLDSCFSETAITLGDDINTCNIDTVITLDAGAGFDSYAWMGGGTDQTLTTDGHPATYVVSAWDNEGCVARDTIEVKDAGCTPVVEVTFEVDMTNETVSGNGVYVAGSFQGWDPAATALAAGAEGKYSVTLSLEVGSTHNFKFLNGNDWPMVESVPGECGVGNDLNREIMIPAMDTIYSVCFAQCTETCSWTTGTEMIDLTGSWNVYPVPSTGMLTLTSQLNNAQVRVIDIVGQEMHKQGLAKGANAMDLTNLPNGVYIVQVIAGEQQSFRKIQIVR